MINYDYIFKKILLLVDDNPLTDSSDMVFSLDYGNIDSFKKNEYEEETDFSVYEGILIPVNFIHEKLNMLSELYIISLEKYTENGEGFIKTSGVFEPMKDFNSIESVVSAIEKKIGKYDDVDDLFIFAGYKMNSIQIVDLDDFEQDVMESIENISAVVQSTLEAIEQAQEKLCLIFEKGTKEQIKKYEKLKELSGYIGEEVDNNEQSEIYG